MRQAVSTQEHFIQNIEPSPIHFHSNRIPPLFIYFTLTLNVALNEGLWSKYPKKQHWFTACFMWFVCLWTCIHAWVL